MRNNLKLHLLAIFPLLLVLILVYFANAKQYQQLTEQATDVYRQGLISTRKTELKNLVEVAEGAVAHIYQDQSLTEAVAQERVKAVLSDMLFGKDGYYFAYDYNGVNQVLPNQPHRLGTNMIGLKDVNGVMIIEELINVGKRGGDFTEYIFNQPSKGGDLGKKISYAAALERWQWIIGTGVYIDDIDQQANDLNLSLKRFIDSSARLTLMIGVIAVVIIFGSGSYVRFTESRVANRKLIELNERIFKTQEEERQRVARELHDGISQTIASAKFSLETAELLYSQGKDVSGEIDDVKQVISQVMREIRGISHRLHPGILDDHGLGAALEELGSEYQRRTGIEVRVKRLMVTNIINMEVKTALYRIAQEAMANIERHANATKVDIALEVDKRGMILEIKDNGCGFSLKNSDKSSDGIGLRNMKERLSHFKGELQVDSDSKGTCIKAKVPRSLLNYNAQSSANHTTITTENKS